MGNLGCFGFILKVWEWNPWVCKTNCVQTSSSGRNSQTVLKFPKNQGFCPTLIFRVKWNVKPSLTLSPLVLTLPLFFSSLYNYSSPMMSWSRGLEKEKKVLSRVCSWVTRKLPPVPIAKTRQALPRFVFILACRLMSTLSFFMKALLEKVELPE